MPDVADDVVDEVVVDVELADLAVDKRPTAEMRPMANATRLVIDLDDPTAVAEFLEAVARSIREKRRCVLIVE